MKVRKSLITVLTLALCGLILGCQGASVETTDVPAMTAVPSVATAVEAPVTAPTSVATTVEATVTAPAAGAQLPNPAAVYCQDKGYAYEIRTAADGSQSGVCILPDGTECDEWAYYRGECGPAQPAPSGTTPGLWLDKTEFEPGEEILVHFSTSGTFANDAWLGIIPAEVPHGSEATNDQYDLAYEYLDGQAEGVLTFAAPSEPGLYDLRLHDTDSDGREVASVPFTVLGGPEKAELWLDKTRFAPGEEIQVHFTALATFSSGAWVGIIPSDVPHGSEATNDENDVDYDYLEGQVSGVLSFLAPMEPGSYDLRMQDSDSSDGQEVASVTFEVSGN